ncbi:MAG: LysM peptidoglycan-binding domain-containing protein [Prevotella sp.]|nr:LysM peptidoglycan-binding domain-containing protein [Staphylococcus sp.]MCM1350030.1 LysM peptidoglycan-binding domain-containing protein [Prevotella sp.]
MNTHIVRVNEKIERIALIYNLTIDEIIKINHHIQDWEHLIPGTKIRLPEIPEIVQTELDNTEPFIEEYYPKIDIESLQTKIKQESFVNVSQKTESATMDKKEEKTSPLEEVEEMPKKAKPKVIYPAYPPYYMNGYYPPYYPNGYYRSTRKKKK